MLGTYESTAPHFFHMDGWRIRRFSSSIRHLVISFRFTHMPMMRLMFSFRRKETNTDDSVASSLEDCCICLENMKPTDLAHPLMCPNCHFNLCCQCLERLYGSATCPNCRSNISHTIGDTILLRKIDDLEKNHEWCKPIVSEIPILQEIANARYREATFWSNDNTGRCIEDQRDEEDEEHGFEVDVRVGPHNSIKLPVETSSSPILHSHKIDATLLAGVESVMSYQEQENITRLLTSGDPNELAMAASALANIAHTVISKQRSLADDASPRRIPELSIYELIQDGQRARRGKQRNKIPSMQPSTAYIKYYSAKAAHFRATDRQVQRQNAKLRQFPLPSRMPKIIQYVETLSFVDSTWDGTLQDAYGTSTTSNLKFQCSAEYHDLSLIRIDTPRDRIVLANAGKQGERPGDVVTHVNGSPVACANAQLLRNFLQNQPQPVRLTLNADLAVAEALKRRHKSMQSSVFV